MGCNEIEKKLLGHYIWHCVKYLEMQASSDPNFPVYGQNRIRLKLHAL